MTSHTPSAAEKRRGAPRRQLTDHVHRYPHVRGQHRRPLKPFRRDADHGERPAVQLQRLADDGRVAVEASHPEVVTQNGERGTARLLAVFGREQPADVRPRAEHAEVVRRNHVAVDALGAVAAAEAHRLRTDAVRVYAAEHGVARSDVHVIRI
jgi:hypothetical protein